LPPRAAVFFFTAFAGLAADFVEPDDFADFAEPDDLVVFEDAFAFDAFDVFDALADFPAFDAFAFDAFAGFDALALVLFFGFAMSLRPPAGC
jgi:hypothetical protein